MARLADALVLQIVPETVQLPGAGQGEAAGGQGGVDIEVSVPARFVGKVGAGGDPLPIRHGCLFPCDPGRVAPEGQGDIDLLLTCTPAVCANGLEAEDKVVILALNLHPDLHLECIPQFQAALFQETLTHQAGVSQPL